jgi:hypothetical protein
MGPLLTFSGLPQFASLVERYGWAWLILEKHQKPRASLMLESQLNIGLKWAESFRNFDSVRGTGKLTL